jgi:hypothetical protein
VLGVTPQPAAGTWTGRFRLSRRYFILLSSPRFRLAVSSALPGMRCWGFAEEHMPSNLLTDALTLTLASQQGPDGSWNVGDIRPPLFDASAIHYTALAIRGLRDYMPPGRRAEGKARITRARQCLTRAVPRHAQDEAFALLGLVWAQASDAEVSRHPRRLLALQREHGGWDQRPTMHSDAYQTGQALYALHASGMAATDPVYRKGAQYLLRTQLEDGTWFTQSRAFAFQVYFETGFPHGTNQFISAAATAPGRNGTRLYDVTARRKRHDAVHA